MAERTPVDLALSDFFIENAGQLRNDEIRFYAASGVMQVGFAESAMLIRTVDRAPSHFAGAPPVWNLKAPPPSEAVLLRSAVLRIGFEGSRLVIPEGRDPLPHEMNFYIGNDPAGWRSGVRSFREIVYEDLYDGIDLVYRMGADGLKYDFLVHPDADPGRIKMAYEGVESWDVSSDRLILRTSAGEIRDEDLVAAAGGDPVQCAFVRTGARAVGFACEGWNRAHTLDIDPLIWATFLGASREEDAMALALDSSGNPIVAGWTYSPDFPSTPGAYDVTFNGDFTDAFVAKLSADGSSLLWATFLGGGVADTSDAVFGLALDGTGNVVLGGDTYASDFPTTPGAYDTTHNGAADAFVAKLSADGSSLLWATFLGGGDADHAWALTRDASGDLVVGGETQSTDFPATTGAYDGTLNGLEDAFVAKLSADGSSLLWATFLGGSGTGEDEAYAFTVDGSGNPVVAGVTYSPDFPSTAGAYDVTFSGGFTDAFVAKLNVNGSALLWSTFLGGGGADQAFALAHDASGDLVVAGRTLSSDFPATPGAYDVTFNGDGDAFVAKLNADGSALLWATFLGGSQDETVSDFVPDGSGCLVMTGTTGSTDFPVTADAYDVTFNGFVDAFVGKLNANGSALLWSTFLGGTDAEQAASLALDAFGHAVIAGRADSVNFPVTAGAYDSTLNGRYEAFVAKVSINRPPTANAGPDQTAQKRRLVTLDGIGSSDPDGDALTFSWTQLGGSPVTLVGGDTANPTFTPPRAGTYTFRLSVDDGRGGTSADAVEVTAWGLSPTARLVADRTPASAGTGIVFDCSDSSDPDGIIVDYAFAFGDGAAGNGTDVSRSHSYGAPGTYTVVLTVTDEDGNTSRAQVTVEVTALAVPASANWKPLVAGLFAFVLAVAGAWGSRRRPWKGAAGRRAVVVAFAITSAPFVITEASTGVLSLFTGQLSIPPVLELGTAVDTAILFVGTALAFLRAMGSHSPRIR